MINNNIAPDIRSLLEQYLTPDQLDAAIDNNNEVLTLACAGSGKSRTLAFRIARLILEGVDPKSIVAFTFTEKAADSIKRQVAVALQAAGLSPTLLGAMYIGTIHSYCQYVLGLIDARYRQFEVLDDNRFIIYLISRAREILWNQIRQQRNARYFDTVKELANAWKIINDEMFDLNAVSNFDPILGDVLLRTRILMNRDQFIDFSLMIRSVVDCLRENNPNAVNTIKLIRHLLVDEYQDVNQAQEELIREIRRLGSSLFVVGDDDQSIYGWRGANVQNILTFNNRYPGSTRHTLSQNFRSTSAIVDASNSFAQQELGAVRIGKTPIADNPPGPRQFQNLFYGVREDEAVWVAERIQLLLGKKYIERDGTIRGLTPGDFAILMRSTRQEEQDGTPRHTAFTNELTARGISYSLEAGGGVFERPHINVLRGSFGLLRIGSPTREDARNFYDNAVITVFPNSDFNRFSQVLADWGRRINTPTSGPRQRLYPQQLVYDLLSAFGISETDFDNGVMRDLGVFSKIIQDVESVYLSIDSERRFSEIVNFIDNVAETGYDTSTEDVIRRPDAVTVSTVHKMKGLEFPVVFVSDVESGRFPGSNHSYCGWLPPQIIRPALQRGSYQGNSSEEARLFYTALTRAERFLYVTGCELLPAGSRRRRPSPFAQRLNNREISTNPLDVPQDLEDFPQKARIDEAVLPTSFSEIRYFLKCPKDYQYRKSFGFSPPIKEMLGYGQTVHTAVEKLHELFPDSVPTPDEAEGISNDVFHLKHVAESADPVNRPGPYEAAKTRAAQIIRAYAQQYEADFQRLRQVEARFEIPVNQAVISGSIDLLVLEAPNGDIIDANVIDFKTMEAGPNPEQNEELSWTELALQVQLYARAAGDVLGVNARTGSVHLLRDNQRIEIPIDGISINSAVSNIEWAVSRILAGDFPMRPSTRKCQECDFKQLCRKIPEAFQNDDLPPAISIPGASQQLALCFSEYDSRFTG